MRKIWLRSGCAACIAVLMVMTSPMPVSEATGTVRGAAGQNASDAASTGPGYPARLAEAEQQAAAAGPGTAASEAERGPGSGTETAVAGPGTAASEAERGPSGGTEMTVEGPGTAASGTERGPGGGTETAAGGPGAVTSEAERGPSGGTETAAAEPGTAAGPGGAAQTGPGSAKAGAGSDPFVPTVSEEEIDAYFDDAVFIGDSVMLGYRNYAMRRPDTWLSRVQFLCSGSYSTSNALQPVSSSSIHPLYAGQQRPIWESIAMMGVKKVFICFGLNDLNISGIEGACENYRTIVANIKALTPDAEIHLISMTYTLAGAGKGKLRNDNIRLFNDALVQLTAENGWGFVNLAPHLADANGDLAPAYCSDNYVHLTTAAYDVWSQVMRDYAKEQLEAAARASAGAGPVSELY